MERITLKASKSLIAHRLILRALGCFIFLILSGSAMAQNYYNYPTAQARAGVPSEDTDGNTAGAGQGAAGQESTGPLYDYGTGALNTNVALKRKIQDGLDVRKQIDAIYGNWLKLSILGRDQNEIEDYFREIPPETLELAKNRLRSKVLRNLESAGMASYTRSAYDLDDIKVARRLVERETQRMGLEHDEQLKYMIKERYGFNPFTLDQLAYMIR